MTPAVLRRQGETWVLNCPHRGELTIHAPPRVESREFVDSLLGFMQRPGMCPDFGRVTRVELAAAVAALMADRPAERMAMHA